MCVRGGVRGDGVAAPGRSRGGDGGGGGSHCSRFFEGLGGGGESGVGGPGG